jgi:RHS repeat-associated protein
VRRVLLTACLLVLAASFVSGQVPNLSDTTSTPIPGAGHNYLHMLTETVDPSNGSVSVRIQLPVPKGRGVTLPMVLAYDSNGAHFIINKAPGSLGWGESEAITGFGAWSYGVPTLSVGSTTVTLNDGQNTQCEVAIDYMYQDPTGARYPLNLSITGFSGRHTSDSCSNNFSQFTLGGSGPVLASTTALGNGASFYLEPVKVADPDGGVVSFPGQISTGTLAASSVEDRNGNVVSITGASGAISYSDTLGRTAVSISAVNSSEDNITISGLSPYHVYWNNSVPFAFGVNMTQESMDGCSQSGANGNDRDISSITLPNGKSYTFTYDGTYGLLQKITYPTGGYVRYVWGVNSQAEYGEWDTQTQYNSLCAYIYDDIVVTDRYVSFDGSAEVLHQHFSYSTNWTNKAQGTWSAKTTTLTTYDLLRGGSFQTVYTYAPQYIVPQPNTDFAITNYVPEESQIQYYGWSGTLLRTVVKGWYDQYRLECELNSPGSGLVSGSFYNYAAGDQVKDKRDYDYGQITSLSACANGAPMPSVTPRREVTTAYRSFTATPIFPSEPSIFDRPSQIVTYGGGSRVAETDYSYNPSVSSAGITIGRDGTYNGNSSLPRGNIASKTEWLNTGGTSPVTSYSYDDTGQMRSMIDPCGNTACSDMSGSNHTTSYSYADNFASGTPPGQTNAYLTQITYPNTGAAHQEHFAYNYADGQLAWSKDQNQEETSYFYNDSLDRLTETDYPDGGSTCFAYNDFLPSVETTQAIAAGSTCTSGTRWQSTSIMDGVGHIVRTELTSDPEGTDYTDTTYDGDGLVWKQSNPYRSTSDPSYGFTTDSYDALGRITSVQYADSNTETTSYSANCSTVTDPALKPRKRCSDGLGRLGEVYEDPNGLNYLTTYAYDALDNLTTVAQGSSQTRTFGYDSLSRQTSTANPESGTKTYTYDANGNMSTRTAPLENHTTGTVTTTYQYDALNRVLSKSYSDGTPTAGFGYDQTTVHPSNGWTPPGGLQNTVGRLSSTNTGVNGLTATATVYNYDAMGRVANYWQCTPYNCANPNANPLMWAMSYTYDLAGDVTSWTHPAGFTITNVIDGAQHVTQIECAANCPSNSPSNLAKNVTYTAWGAVATLQNGKEPSGCTLGQNCPEETYVYNNRLQPVMIELGTGSNASADYCLVYNYYPSDGTPTACGTPAQGSEDNGNVKGYLYQDNVNPSLGHSAVFDYDAVNRLTLAVADPLQQGGASYSYTFAYSGDGSSGQYGNMSCTPNAGQCATDLTYSASTNRITSSGYAYDAAGNLTQGVTGTGSHTYRRDAEGRLVSVDGGATQWLVYNALGQQVEWGPTPQYELLFDAAGQWEGRWVDPWNAFDVSGVFYLGGRQFGLYYNAPGSPLNGAWFDHVNALGSAAMGTKWDGSQLDDVVFNPWGEIWQYTALDDYHFAGFQFENFITDLDPTLYRSYEPLEGRWLTPDPDNAGADPADPQTWNAYAYAGNNPTTFTDPSGEDYKACIDNGSGGQSCFYDPSDYNFQQAVQQAGATLQNGQILENVDGQQVQIGTYQQFVGPGEEGGGLQDQTANLLVVAGLAEAGVRGVMALGEEGLSAIGRLLGSESGENAGVVIGKMPDLVEPGALSPGERTLDLPDLQDPQANWVQNSSKLRKAIAEGRPIRDLTAQKYGGLKQFNTGFLRAERNILENHGWTYSNGYWYPPGR